MSRLAPLDGADTVSNRNGRAGYANSKGVSAESVILSTKLVFLPANRRNCCVRSATDSVPLSDDGQTKLPRLPGLSRSYQNCTSDPDTRPLRRARRQLDDRIAPERHGDSPRRDGLRYLHHPASLRREHDVDRKPHEERVDRVRGGNDQPTRRHPNRHAQAAPCSASRNRPRFPVRAPASARCPAPRARMPIPRAPLSPRTETSPSLPLSAGRVPSLHENTRPAQKSWMARPVKSRQWLSLDSERFEVRKHREPRPEPVEQLTALHDIASAPRCRETRPPCAGTPASPA